MIQAIPTKEPTITIPVAEYQKMFAAVAKLDTLRAAVAEMESAIVAGIEYSEARKRLLNAAKNAVRE